MNLPRLSGDGRQVSLGHMAHVLVLTAGIPLGCTLLSAGGCAPLGIYSLVHNLSAHHVLKPVIAETPLPETANHEGQVLPADASSRLPEEPMSSSLRGEP